MKEKGRFLKKYRGNECLNCEVPLDIIDRYCHNCGQINTTKKLSFKDFFNEFFASIFSYDSRLRHTIVGLLFKPGIVSKDYVEGKRIKYANPFRFYLSVSILFFIISGLFIDFESVIPQKNDQNKELIEVDTSDQTPDNNTITNDSLSKIQDTDESVYFNEIQLDTMGTFKAVKNRWKTYKSYYKKTGELSANKALDSLHHNKNGYTKYLYKRSIRTKNLNENPMELLKFVFNKLPFIIFFFLPFFALTIWLLYIRRSFNYMEHLVFIFHTQTMFFILMGIAILIDQITKSEAASGIAMLVFLFYLYKAMRNFYQQKRAKTIVKFLLVNVLFFILASIGSFVTIIGSMFIF
ncbi:DUF3667 domain-containing protein [Aquimarina sp. 2201CG14-23]|uniref:DUF3667 domain-containing protein n=1 Tax=Aquimarina mycalae TaxID=3040073 RepID=UPI002478059E|nr:DUF3667 domain-containing protein [Aquimarina sp. 2201CG14-23]MDH7445090.1 DUF3667 domain-containing protein [Aquimarina sp. 2201CG14-23]